MTTYEVTYSLKTASGFDITRSVKGLTLDEADRICNFIDELEDYKLVDVSAEI